MSSKSTTGKGSKGSSGATEPSRDPKKPSNRASGPKAETAAKYGEQANQPGKSGGTKTQANLMGTRNKN